jgi:tetratricopeptide (TPR) repeat protein
MKALNLFIILLLATFTLNAQTSTKLTAALKKGIMMLDSAKTEAQYAQAATYFNHLADADSKEWLAQYYAAYSNLLTGIHSKSNSTEVKDGIYDKAFTYLSRAEVLSPKNSEVYVLKGYITFMKMSVEPQQRAALMMPEAEVYMQQAIQYNPQNPRAYLIAGQNAFYTPQMFGGGKDVAKPILTKGMQTYSKQTATGAEPCWGKVRCADLLKQCE